MIAEEILKEAILLQHKCLEEDIKLQNRAFRVGKLIPPSGVKIQDHRLKKIYNQLGSLINSLKEKSIAITDAEVTCKILTEQFSEYTNPKM